MPMESDEMNIGDHPGSQGTSKGLWNQSVAMFENWLGHFVENRKDGCCSCFNLACFISSETLLPKTKTCYEVMKLQNSEVTNLTCSEVTKG